MTNRKPSFRLVTLRLQPWQHELLTRAAQAHGKSFNRWCVDGLSKSYQLPVEFSARSRRTPAARSAPAAISPLANLEMEQLLAFVS